METDIRMMIEGLRPVDEFRSAVERTISVLNVRIEDIFVCDEEEQREVDELTELRDFWERVREGMGA